MLPVTIAPPQGGAGLTLFPLVTGAVGDTEYDLLPDALEAGTVVITEVGEQGTVPELLAVNRGPRDVLVLDGMQLIGAKQNRTVGRTILLAAGTETRIPVSCMEQGRWSYAARGMRGGLHHSPAKVRRRTRSVEALEAREAPEAAERLSPSDLLARAQGDVWAAIRESSARLGAHSPTGALDDVLGGAGPRLGELESRFPLVDGQVGFVAFLGGEPVGADLLDSPAAYGKLHRGLVRGYVFEALEAEATTEGRAATRVGDGDPAESAAGAPGAAGMAAKAPDGPIAGRARGFLETLDGAERRPLPTVGRGEYRSLAGAVVGGELELDGRVIHLSAFPA